jgi:eukaryotic-like serine/threonine-protein kinase
VRTPFTEQFPRLSPDGHWLAFVTNESGRNEVMVQSFPEAGAKTQISTSGGLDPPTHEIQVTMNWFEELKRLVPAK